MDSIKDSDCKDATTKFKYFPPNSEQSMWRLLHDKIFVPDNLARSVNTSEYGFANITSERNETHLCFAFFVMSEVASVGHYEIHQACGVQMPHIEKKQRIEFVFGEYLLGLDF